MKKYQSKLSLLFGAGLGLLLLLVGNVLAQTGGGFDLSWSTIDGGGETFSTGGAYRLGGTIGQPDAGQLAGGTYSLNGGFWQAGDCLVPPAPTLPTITATTGDIVISWGAIPEASSYLIYRSINDPYFVPTVLYDTISSSPWTDSDTDEVGNTAENHTYIIHATNGCGESIDSQRIGEFDFGLVPGA